MELGELFAPTIHKISGTDSGTAGYMILNGLRQKQWDKGLYDSKWAKTETVGQTVGQRAI
jgi:hypothetical protein